MFYFEKPHDIETQISREMEKIELAHAKTVEKFEGHDNCLAFIDFLKTTEKIFMEARYRNWNADKSKEELIGTEIKLVAERSGLPEEMLQAIYEEFHKSYVSIGKISDTIEELLEKYKEKEDCEQFIFYLRDIYVGFEDVRRGGREMIDLKNNLIRAKMMVLSSDGNPEIKLLEEIYNEFKGNLNENKN